MHEELEKKQVERLRNLVIKKEIKATGIKKLKQPKDRLKIGKALLNLKQCHGRDKVLRNMILEEFAQTKLAKYPLEYEHYDSDEEDMIKHGKAKGISTKKQQ